MKKLLVFLCAMSLLFCVAGAAQANVYEYFSGEDQFAVSGDSYSFFFDLVLPNGDLGISPFTNSELTLVNDEAVGWDALPMQNAYVVIELWSNDPPLENVEIVLNAYYGGTSHVLFNGDIDLHSGSETFVFDLVGDEFDAFAPDPLGEITLSLGTPSNNDFNDFFITEVGIGGEPSPSPEPATMFLLGSGLVGLVSLGRKKFFRK